MIPRTFEKRRGRALIILPVCPWEPGQEREGLHLSCDDQTTAAVTCHVAFWLPAALCGPFSTLCLNKPTHFSANRLGIDWGYQHTLSSISTSVVQHDGFLDWSCKSRPFFSSAGPQEPRSLRSIVRCMFDMSARLVGKEGGLLLRSVICLMDKGTTCIAWDSGVQLSQRKRCNSQPASTRMLRDTGSSSWPERLATQNNNTFVATTASRQRRR